MSKKSIISFFLFFATAFCVLPDVYMLRPGHGKNSDGNGAGTTAPSENLSEALAPHRLWIEQVIVNGVSIDLEISLLEEKSGVCLDRIKELFPDALISSNGNSFLAEIKGSDGKKKRIYVIGFGGAFPAVQFFAELPERIGKDFIWPNELPLPSDATPVRCISLPSRRGVCGYFKSSFEPSMAMGMMKSELKADGWTPFGESPNMAGSSAGELFTKNNPLRVMAVDIGKDAAGGSSGTVFLRVMKDR